LAGELGKKFGRVWKLVCPTPGHALRLIGLAQPAFKRYMMEKAKEGMRFHVINDKRSRCEQELPLPVGKRLIISQEVVGAKHSGSLLEIVAGVALIAFAWWNPLGWSAGVEMAIGEFGATLVLSGITQLLSPQAPGSTASYYFNGASNTITQGQPVPVVYGEMMIGGLPISSSLVAVDLSTAPTETGLITD
jgi:predicted phage tail protein